MSKVVTKTEKAINLWIQGETIKALALFSNFRLGISKEDRDVLKRAYEMNNGNGSTLYAQMGYNSQEQLEKATEIVERIWIPDVRCNNCMWTGDEADLEVFEDGLEHHIGCPTCKTDNYLMNLK